MKCPFCGADETAVADTRLNEDGDVVRRRRKCNACDKRFTTYERAEIQLPQVVKKNGLRTEFSGHPFVDRVVTLKREWKREPGLVVRYGGHAHAAGLRRRHAKSATPVATSAIAAGTRSSAWKKLAIDGSRCIGCNPAGHSVRDA